MPDSMKTLNESLYRKISNGSPFWQGAMQKARPFATGSFSVSL